MSETHLPPAAPLGQTELAIGGLYRHLREALRDPDEATAITVAIERLIDAKIKAALEKRSSWDRT
jgi:hypothetical protein